MDKEHNEFKNWLDEIRQEKKDLMYGIWFLFLLIPVIIFIPLFFLKH